MAVRRFYQKKASRGSRKILLVTPRFPFPVIGGDKLRVYNIVKYLSNYYGFTLASLYSTEEEERAVPEAGIFGEVYRVRQGRLASWRYTAGNLLRGKSLQCGYFYNPRLKKLVDSALPGHSLVLAHLIRASDYVWGSGVPSICEMTDAISMNYERAWTSGGRSLRNFIYRLEHRRCLDAEKMCLDAFDGCVVVSPNDKGYLAGRYPQYTSKMHVIPNGVHVKEFPMKRDKVTPGKIVFIGNMRTLQNADAASYFAREVFPGIREKVPGASFRVIGADPGRQVRSLASIPGVVVTGRVKDIREEACDAAVSVCPVRIGAGIQNKVLESMAMGIPVVTTTVGGEGLMAESGRHFTVAGGAVELKEAVIELLTNRTKAEAFSRAGRALMEGSYSWERMLRAYRDLVERVMDEAEGRDA
ncbi:polysaccharide biosynthesis protein PslH [Anaerolineae bacterium]|nr:polysaccharide biosynthesis protein PslH [Anaerolineae bacterium]